MLEDEARQLQERLARIDLELRAANAPSGAYELLLLKRDRLRIRMTQERNHHRPHVHIDCGRSFHCASYSIEAPPTLLAGTLDRQYEREVSIWISKNVAVLYSVWETLQRGHDVADSVLVDLQGDL